MKARADSQYSDVREHMESELDLGELNRLLAALTNSHMHYDLRGTPEVERQVAMADIRQQIEELLSFQQSPWQAALEEAVQKVNNEYAARTTKQLAGGNGEEFQTGAG